MKILEVNGYLDGGTLVLTCKKEDQFVRYYIDNRINTRTRGEIYLSYPRDDSEKVSDSTYWEIVEAVKEYRGTSYSNRSILELLGTA
jgi:hypothetical protein